MTVLKQNKYKAKNI